jgi:hypothetical protein
LLNFAKNYRLGKILPKGSKFALVVVKKRIGTQNLATLDRLFDPKLLSKTQLDISTNTILCRLKETVS